MSDIDLTKFGMPHELVLHASLDEVNMASPLAVATANGVIQQKRLLATYKNLRKEAHHG